MNKTHCFIITVGFKSVVWGLCAPALAQDDPGMQVDVSRCVAITNSDQRYRCFDQITVHLRHEIQQGRVTGSAPALREEVGMPAVAAPHETTVREFGLDSSNAEVANNDEQDAELRDTIAHLEEREPGRWLVTLNSGQVWYQETTGKIRLKERMKVRIYPSTFGSSYRLAPDGVNGFVQVRRIK